ncbi:MAG: hypothetical protein U9P88_02585 [Patescibacteria group bacterium]|nr:hypothetical protein [Patescibacteria group bacterium]
MGENENKEGIKLEDSYTFEELFGVETVIKNVLKMDLTQKIELLKSMSYLSLDAIEQVVDNLIKDHKEEVAGRYKLQKSIEMMDKHGGIKKRL